MSHLPSHPKAPLPTRKIFDPYNSTSSGHQRAENGLAGSSSWRESRSYKLAHQFRDPSGRGGSKHLADLVGGGRVSLGEDGRLSKNDWRADALRLREPGCQDIRGLLSGSRKRSSDALTEKDTIGKKRRINGNTDDKDHILNSHTATSTTKCKASQSETVEHDSTEFSLSPPSKPLPQIFRGLTMFLNGSTMPEISDYKLKQLFVQHGGNSSIALGRRTVTHVILGKICGGGLASSKINKEVTTVGGKGIKYVTAQWVIDSVEKGIRQPEHRYLQSHVAKRIGGSGQGSVKSMFTIMQPSRDGG